MKNKYTIYWLMSENKKNTYIGFTSELKRRLIEHNNKKVKTTKNFGNFKPYLLEKVDTIQEARIKEKYWKSHVGRKKLKNIFKKI